MMARYARVGRIDWIGLRPARRAKLLVMQSARLEDDGLEGDHAKAGKRALTLIQAEHLPVIAMLANHDAVTPELLRRNVVVSGLNLLGFRKRQLRLGSAVIEITGPCPPCSRMEEALGNGGYTAMRGHGGVYATVIAPGDIRLGDTVRPVTPES